MMASPLRAKRGLSSSESAPHLTTAQPFGQRKRLQQLNTAHPVPAMDEQDCSRAKRSRVVDAADENLDIPVRSFSVFFLQICARRADA